MSIAVRDVNAAEFQRAVYFASPEAEDEWSDLFANDYWVNIAHLLQEHDLIEVIRQDGAYWGMLLVVKAEPPVVKVKELMFKELESVPETGDSPVEVKWQGPTNKWCLVRKSDGAVVTKGIANKDEATEEAMRYSQKEAVTE